jgi:hypothetical protein
LISKSPGDWKRYHIDYILGQPGFRNSLGDMKTFPRTDIDSNYNLKLAEVQTLLKAIETARKSN